MSLVVNHNLMAMNAARNLTTIYGRLSNSVQRLSSGMRINSAADDAAGLAIRELMRADIATLNQGIRNASDAISMIQTAEGAMSVIDEKLIRMKELAEQAATGTYTTAQREIMDSEYQAMAAEIDRIANATDFNGVKLLDGSLATLHSGSGLKVHFGTGNSSAEDYYYLTVGDMRATRGTGLRVGNSDTRDTWVTNSLNMSSADGLFAGSDTGVFGIQYTSDGGTTWNTYGWVTVDSDDTLTSIVEEINQGPVWTATLSADANASSVGLEGQTLTINGNVFTFTTAEASSTANTISTANLTGTGTSVIQAIMYAINSQTTLGVSTLNALATSSASGLTITIFHEDFGTPTTSTTLGEGHASLTLSTSYTQTTGNPLGASAVWEDSNGYELRLRSNHTGDNYQVRMLNSNGDIIDYSASGVTLTTGGLSLPTTDATYLSDIDLLDAASEWTQAANGSGTTSWAAKDILTQSAAQQALAGLDTAINTKDTTRANLGAISNRLENTITNLQIQAENLQAAESRISDVDVATEMTEFTRNNILAQAAVAMLAQANSLPSLALTLLGG